MMRNLGFGEKWLRWMKSCISTTKVSVLVNSSPTEEFSPQRGLRQRDPLSPFLFNIVTEGLNILLEKAKERRLIRGTVVEPNEMRFSHLQFADDTIVFCKGDEEEILTIKRILRCFELMSGLKINFHKSVVCGIGIQDSAIKEMAKKLNCLTQKLSTKYLGLPFGANPRRKSTWQPVVEKIRVKLGAWKRKLFCLLQVDLP